MSCADTKCEATLVRYENPDFTHPFDNPASTFICTRVGDGKQVYSQLVYDHAIAEYQKVIAGLNGQQAVHDSCPRGCVCQIEWEKRGAVQRVTLPGVQIVVTVTATGGSPASVTYSLVTTCDKVTIHGRGQCADAKKT